MNETELLRRLVEEPPQRDDLAMARARQSLRELMAQESLQGSPPPASTRPLHRPRLRPWLVALVGLILATFALQLVLPSGRGGPSTSAANELASLGRLAAGARPLQIPAGSYLYSQVEEVHPQTMTQLGDAQASFSIIVHDILRTWLSADGSARRSTTFIDVSFASPADEQAWRQAGSPPLPQAGSTAQERDPAGSLLSYDLDALPTEPEALLAAIRAGDAGPPPADDFALLEQVADLLAQGTASPELRQGLFGVAAAIPSVRLDRDATDPFGRSGVGLIWSDAAKTMELIFDPDTSAILATEFHETNGELASWQVFSAQGLVSSPDARVQPTPFSAK